MNEKEGLKEIIVLKLDHHLARRTNARTTWKVNGIDLDQAVSQGLVKLLYNTWSGEKTHFDVFIMPMQQNLVFTRIRISNRGNPSIQKFTSLEEMKPYMATAEEIEFLKAEGKI